MNGMIEVYFPVRNGMDLRGRSKDVDIQKILINFQGDYYYDYYKKGVEIPKPIVPEKYTELIRTGELRDIIEKLNIDSWKSYDLKTLHETFESNRRKAYLILFKELNNNHPSLKFVKEIVDEYRTDFDIEKLRIWDTS